MNLRDVHDPPAWLAGFRSRPPGSRGSTRVGHRKGIREGKVGPDKRESPKKRLFYLELVSFRTLLLALNPICEKG